MNTLNYKLPAPTIAEVAELIIADSDILNNPYFVSIPQHEMALSDFQQSQQQFYFAVLFFPRPMAALMARITDPVDRLGILENINEEHGGFCYEHMHPTTFKTFLDRVGCNTKGLSDIEISPQVASFNHTLLSVCSFSALETGLACLGIIEYAFADISATLAKAIVDRRWLDPDSLIHYNLHASIDKQHAADFFKLIEPEFHNAEQHRLIIEGLKLGIYIFNRLYQDLYTCNQDLRRQHDLIPTYVT